MPHRSFPMPLCSSISVMDCAQQCYIAVAPCRPFKLSCSVVTEPLLRQSLPKSGWPAYIIITHFISFPKDSINFSVSPDWHISIYSLSKASVTFLRKCLSILQSASGKCLDKTRSFLDIQAGGAGSFPIYGQGHTLKRSYSLKPFPCRPFENRFKMGVVEEPNRRKYTLFCKIMQWQLGRNGELHNPLPSL